MRSAGEIIVALVETGLNAEQKALLLELAALATMPALADDAAKAARRERNRRYYESKKLSKTSEPGLNKTSEIGSETSETPPNKTSYSEPVSIGSSSSERSEKKPRQQRGSRLADDWSLSDTDRQFALNEGLTPEEIDREVDGFRDYWRSVAGSRGCKLDWSATWRNRIRDIAGRKRERLSRVAAGSHAKPNGSGASFVDILAQRRGSAGGPMAVPEGQAGLQADHPRVGRGGG